MLTLYRRHTKKCGKKSRKYRRCPCPIWVDGTIATDLGVVEVRKSLNTTDWETAAKLMNDLEAGSKEAVAAVLPKPEPMTFLEAKEKYLEAVKQRNLARLTEEKYKHLMRQMEGHFSNPDTKVKYLEKIDIDVLRGFMGTLKDGPLSRVKKIDRIKNFFTFCLRSGWISENPAEFIEPPIVKDVPTLPFTDDEVKRILDAAKGRRKTLCLLMLYSGLRISDAVTLKSSSLISGKLFLRQEKTGEPVYVPLPPSLVEELRAIPLTNGHFFCTGVGRKQTTTNNWRERLNKVFKDAKVDGAHPHRFRDTFAVNLLNKGVSMENVSKLLGHKSIRITEKHYAPFVEKLRKRLEEEVMKTW